MPTNEERLEEIKKTTQRITENIDSDTSDSDVEGGQDTSTKSKSDDSDDSGTLEPGTEEYKSKAQELTERIKSLSEEREDISLDNIEMDDDGVIDASSIDRISREEGGADVRDMEIPEETTNMDRVRNLMDDVDTDTSALISQELEQVEEEQEEVTGEEDTSLLGRMRDMLDTAPEAEESRELYEQEREDAEVQQKQDKVSEQERIVADLKGKTEEIDEEMRGEIEAIRNSKAPLESIQSSIDQTKTEYEQRKARVNSRLSGESALLSARQNDLDRANNLAEKAVELEMQDYQNELSRWETFYNSNSKIIDSLSQKKQDALENARGELEQEAELERERLEYNMDIMTEAADEGIDLGVDYERAKKMDPTEITDLYMEKAGSGEEAAEDPEDYFTSSQLKEIRREDLDLTDSEDLDKAMEMFPTAAQEAENPLSDSLINKLGAEEVPEQSAQQFQTLLNEGESYEDIYNDLVDSGYDREEVGRQIDRFRDVMKKEGVLSTQAPEVEESFEARARTEKAEMSKEGSENVGDDKSWWEFWK